MAPLSFQVKGQSNSDSPEPRLGRLRLAGRQNVDTPNFLALASRGAIPHMTPDVISSHGQIMGVHMALEDFIERAVTSGPPILQYSGLTPLHSFTALPRTILMVLAPRRTPAVSTPTGNTNTAISVFTSTGFQMLSNKSYINYVRSLRPDIAISLADVAYGSAPGTKRIAKMSDRTQQWLIELLNEKDESQVVFAPILPIDASSQSEYVNYITEEAIDQVSGLAFFDSHLLPDLPATTAASKLPRLSLEQCSSPLHILRQVSLGMDLFTIPFVGFATDAGIALTFRFPSPSPQDHPDSERPLGLELGIDLWGVEHSISLTPLCTSCTCYACMCHHRAYIQHLLSAKEMLGWVLLQIHNHHIIKEFFTAVRRSIAAGTFEADHADFARSYASELPEKSGQGPRVRGYHFKSEGPSETRRNKAAWGNLGSDVQAIDGRLVPDQGYLVMEEKRIADRAK